MLQAPRSPSGAPAGAGALLSVPQGILVLLLIALGFIPGLITVPPIDRDEPRYTQATKQMVETGDYVAIRFQDAPRNKKPIGIHWLQAGAVRASGLGAAAPIAVYRIPSLLGAIAAMLLVGWAARAFLPLSPALLVGALVGATIILGVEARLAKTDAVLLATVVAAQGALARIWLARAKTLAMPSLFWFALALGILVKGPVAPMVAGLTIATLAVLSGRDILGRIRPLLGLGIVAVVCLPWFVAIYLETDGEFFSNALGKDFLGKAASGQEGHWAPPLTHLLSFLAVGWPLAPFAVAALTRVRRVSGPVFLFAAAWAVPSWIVFELIPTKLPHYTLPLVPAIALATVAALLAREPPRWARILVAALAVLVPLGALGAGVALPFQVAARGEGWALFEALATSWLPLALIPVLIAALGAVQILRGTPLLGARVVTPVIVAAVAAQGLVWGGLLPALRPVWVSSNLVAAAGTAARCPDPRLIAVGYREPSMIFLAGTDTLLLSPERAPEALAAERCAVAAVTDEGLARFNAAAAETNVALRAAGVVDGFNISKGDPVRLTLFVAAGP